MAVDQHKRTVSFALFCRRLLLDISLGACIDTHVGETVNFLDFADIFLRDRHRFELIELVICRGLLVQHLVDRWTLCPQVLFLLHFGLRVSGRRTFGIRFTKVVFEQVLF